MSINSKQVGFSPFDAASKEEISCMISTDGLLCEVNCVLVHLELCSHPLYPRIRCHHRIGTIVGPLWVTNLYCRSNVTKMQVQYRFQAAAKTSRPAQPCNRSRQVFCAVSRAPEMPSTQQQQQEKAGASRRAMLAAGKIIVYSC